MAIMQCTSQDIQLAAKNIAAGELVGFPTETVYGLGADAVSDAAVAKIFAAKGRPSDHPLIVHIASPQDIETFVSSIPEFAQPLMKAFWPGPLTLILPRRADIATACAGGQDSIGVRCPSHPMAQALLVACQQLGIQGLAAPSANRFGRISPTSAAHVRDEFGAELLVLDGGDCDVGIESSIVDCTRGVPVLLRPGQITQPELTVVCGQPVLTQSEYLEGPAQSAPHSQDTNRLAPKASGTLASHYAPQARLRLMSSQEAQAALAQQVKNPAQLQSVQIYQLPETPAKAAHELFAKLRALDQAGIQEIWVTNPPEGASWDGVRDRLQRAAATPPQHSAPIL
jgi:L-threonylcarbamoyladenylate synthase